MKNKFHFKDKIKKVTAATLVATSIFSVGAKTLISADSSVALPEETAICISPGEYDGKPGKRASAECVKQANVPSEYKRYSDGSVGENAINKVIVDKVVEYIKANNRFIKVIRFDRKDKSEDLGAAGRRAASTNADLYIGLHTNSTDKSIDKAQGTEFFTPKDGKVYRNGRLFCKVNFSEQSVEIAKNVVSKVNTENTGSVLHGNKGLTINCERYDEINTAAEFMPALIIEAGFFNNPEELARLTNPIYINAIAMEIAKNLSVEIVKDKYKNDQEIEKQVIKKKEDTPEEIAPEKPTEESVPEEEEPKDLQITDEAIEQHDDSEGMDHIDENGLESGNMDVYVRNKKYNVELDTEKDATTAVSEFNNTKNELIEKYGLEEGEINE